MDKEEVISGYYQIEDTPKVKPFFFKKYFIGVIMTTLLVVLALVVLIPEVLVTIHAGEKGVLYKRLFGKEGVVLDKVYSEGLYTVAPWNKMTPYKIRIQQLKNTMTVLSKQGMEIELTISIRYHPKLDSLGYLHQKLGPDYEKTVVIPEVEGHILSVFGKSDIVDIYTNIYALIEKANINILNDLHLNYINIDELIVKSIVFPDAVNEAINEKIKEKQLALSYQYRLETAMEESKRKTIEAKGIQSFQTIISEGISENYLKWKGIDATLKLANSTNSKVIVIGSSKNGLPIILNTDSDENTKKNDK